MTDLSIVSILALFFFQLESHGQKPVKQMRQRDKLSCHVTYSLVAGPIQIALSVCEMAATAKVYAWETSGIVGYAICSITVL